MLQRRPMPSSAIPASKGRRMPRSRHLLRTRVGALAGLAWLASPALAAAGGACVAHGARQAPPVVELYTSEGCSSCPPADRWLSRLKAEPEVIALAFHVDYWDRLGWRDRFASPAYTQRQAQQQISNGARFSYTPQVVVDGVDRTDWPRLALPRQAAAREPAPVVLSLVRDGARVTAGVAAGNAAPRRLAAYWALTEQDHATTVKAGENEGATLKHDHVVRDYRPVAAWTPAADAPRTLVYELPAGADPAHPRQVNLVVVDAASGRPVQAVRIGC
jgi:hypothetical protein